MEWGKWRGKERHQRAQCMTSPIMSTMWCYLNVMAGTGWLRVGPPSQLVMRSFDVADKAGETEGKEALWRGEVRGQPATTAAERRERGKKEREKCGWRQEAAPRRDRKASSQLFTKPPPRPWLARRGTGEYSWLPGRPVLKNAKQKRANRILTNNIGPSAPRLLIRSGTSTQHVCGAVQHKRGQQRRKKVKKKAAEPRRSTLKGTKKPGREGGLRIAPGSRAVVGTWKNCHKSQVLRVLKKSAGRKPRPVFSFLTNSSQFSPSERLHDC